MSATWPDELDRLAERVDGERNRRAPDLEQIQAKADDLLEVVNGMDASWSGSNLGHHAELYFKDFQRPAWEERFDPEWGTIYGLRDGWASRSLEDVSALAEHSAGVALEDLNKQADEHVKACQALRDDLSVAAAPVMGLASHERERKLIEALEAQEWGARPAMSVPGGMTRDSTAIAEGLRLAPHKAYWREVAYTRSKAVACAEFLNDAHRTLRQTVAALKGNPEAVPPVTESDNESRLQELLTMLRRFPRFALQLERRARERPAFLIGDEYDVQDLIKAVLSLYAEDVRPEEWTPSVAGASSRMDFLLKQERIAIETKKTRNGLDAKRLGEELSVDITRYQGHPDVATLVCFVYDRDALVTNPRGFEDDLAALSTETLRVVAVIAS